MADTCTSTPQGAWMHALWTSAHLSNSQVLRPSHRPMTVTKSAFDPLPTFDAADQSPGSRRSHYRLGSIDRRERSRATFPRARQAPGSCVPRHVRHRANIALPASGSPAVTSGPTLSAVAECPKAASTSSRWCAPVLSSNPPYRTRARPCRRESSNARTTVRVL
jgi:hypothetical protein